MRIRVLGCSGGIGAGARTTALLIDNDVLIDAGTGIGDLDLEDLDSYSPRFPDPCAPRSHCRTADARRSVFDENFQMPLTVYAREETLRAVQDHLFNDVIWPDFAKLPSPDKPMLRYHVCSPGDTVTIKRS